VTNWTIRCRNDDRLPAIWASAGAPVCRPGAPAFCRNRGAMWVKAGQPEVTVGKKP